MRYLLLTAVAFCFCFLLCAQNKAADASILYGKVVDSISGQPIEYATISVYYAGQITPITGSITNKKGDFEIDSLKNGTYHLTVEFIGYYIKNITSIISDQNKIISLGQIKLKSKTALLSNVTVTANTQPVENKIDKLIYNVEKDISSQGGMAVDVFRKIPQVSVDIDGNVSLQGNSNIRFLINGKPSTLFGNSVADALQSIPASQIQVIEVITSPGAKYEAEGTAGIINIVLKKNTAKGWNGNLNLNAGTRLENGSVNISYSHHNYNINAYFNGNAQIHSTLLNQYYRKSNDSVNNHTNNLWQNGQTAFNRNGVQSGLGFDWSIGKRSSLSGTVSYESYTSSNTSNINQESGTDSSTGTIVDINSVRNSYNHFDSHSFDFNLSYKKTFATDKQELNITYIGSIGKNYIYYLQSQSLKGNSSSFQGSNSMNPGTDNEMDFAIDYSQPAGKNLLIETGIRKDLNTISSIADYSNLDISRGSYFHDSTQSYHIDYQRNVYAFYLSGTFNLFHFLDVVAGSRYEYTTTDAKYSNTHSVSIPDYNTLVPSIMLSHVLKKGGIFKLGYVKRIERPDYRDLNPFMNRSDPYNIITGNPLLKPEIGNKMSAEYSRSFEKGFSFTATLYYNVNTHDIKSYVLYYPRYQVGDSIYTDVSISTRLNIQSEKTLGLNLFSSFPIGQLFTLRTNLTIANRHINNDLVNKETNGLEYRINANATLILGKNITAEAFGNYNSRVHNVQGLQPAYLFYNFAIRKHIMNKNASIALLTTNPFTQYVYQRTDINGPGFFQYNIRNIPLRSFGINFTYKFGKIEFKKLNEADINLIPNE